MAIRYLVNQSKLSSLGSGFGDNPEGTYPADRFVNEGMPFISVAKTRAETPSSVHHVGGQEHGTARCLDILCDEREKYIVEGAEDSANTNLTINVKTGRL